MYASCTFRMRSDEELMAAYVAGEKKAFSELFSRYGGMLVRLMSRHIRNQDDVQELVQQTFLQLHRARNDFDQSRRLRPWLMTIAFNLKREYYRRRMRKPEAALEHEPPASDRGMDHPLERKNAAVRLRTALTKLPAGQREVIEMHWFQELSFPEVAEILGLSVSAVKVRAHRGYRKLRGEIEAVTN